LERASLAVSRDALFFDRSEIILLAIRKIAPHAPKGRFIFSSTVDLFMD
jgi:hypothetical protein